MPSVIKEMMMNEIKKAFDENSYAFISSFDQLTVADLSELRMELSKTAKRSMLVKHAFAKKVFQDKQYAEAEKFLDKSVLVTFADKDPQVVSKAIVEFAKKNNKIVPQGVVFENKVYGQAFVKRLSALPSRHELLTQVVVRVKSPLSGLAITLNQLLRGVAVALNAIKEKKQAQSA